ncbi:MAG: hypothetical protein U1C57_00820 [Candidatus Doudnabacteria bacterium]|nr:hypothetical protein [bacterium]MDZ4243628.1 hypothetical protein [Candidatus Doudnabacteria bacterium]
MEITLDNFEKVSASELRNPANYGSMEGAVAYIQDAPNPVLAKDLAISLVAKLDPVMEQLPPELAAGYLRLIKVLKLFALATISDKEKETFFADQIADALKLDWVDIRYWTEFLFQIYADNPETLEKLHKTLLSGLSKNKETLGGQKLVIRGENISQTQSLQNWIADYNRWFPLDAVRGGRSRLEEARYVAESPNAKNLRPDEKALLQKILMLYDWLYFVAGRYEQAAKDEPILAPNPAVPSPTPPKVVVSPPPVPRPPSKPREEYRIPASPAGGENGEYRKKTGEGVGRELPAAPRPPQRESRIENIEYGKKQMIKPEILEPRIVPPPARIISEEPIVPRTSSLNEDLYRSTLDELKKQREEQGPRIEESRMENREYRKKEEVVKSPPLSPSPSPLPASPAGRPPGERDIKKKPGFDKNLYRSTLDELNKIRQAYEKPQKQEYRIENREYGKRTPESKPAIKSITPNSTFQIPHSKPAEPPPNLPAQNLVSVNEAIVQAGTKQPPTGQGQMVAGSEYAVERRLKDLERKIDKNPN